MNYQSDFEALTSTIKLDGKLVVDIGCGDGTKAKRLTKLGARVIGIEPDLASWQLEEYSTDGFQLISGGAQELAIESNTADAVIFIYSLHHVPHELMESAMIEAGRVLKDTGVLYIAEPVAKGSYQDVCEPFLDETSIRINAIKAVESYAIPRFDHCLKFDYSVAEIFQDFDQFVAEMMRYRLNRYELEDVNNQTVKNIFKQTFNDKCFQLDQPVRVWVLTNTNDSYSE